jgi:hypothetical protein
MTKQGRNLHTSHEQNRAASRAELSLDQLELVSGWSGKQLDKSRGGKPPEYLTVTMNDTMISSH